MACVCFVCLCDVRHLDKRELCMLLGRGMGKGTPSPSQGRATVRLPPSKFFLFFPKQIFYFFYPSHNIANLPILFASERFSLLSCVFPYPCIFLCL